MAVDECGAAGDFARSLPGLIELVLGRAVLALSEAGLPVTEQALVDELLHQAETKPLLAAPCLHAAWRLGWRGLQ